MSVERHVEALYGLPAKRDTRSVIAQDMWTKGASLSWLTGQLSWRPSSPGVSMLTWWAGVASNKPRRCSRSKGALPRRDEPCTALDSYVLAACCVIACVTGVMPCSFVRRPMRREAAEDGSCHALHLVNYSGRADGLCLHAEIVVRLLAAPSQTKHAPWTCGH